MYIFAAMKSLSAILLCLLLSLSASARHYDLTAQHISTADGLPTNIVSRVWQSADGYIWIATRSGLCRYDGYEVQLFGPNATPIPKQTDELKTRDARWQRTGRGELTRYGTNGSIRSWQLINKDIIAYTRTDHFHVADIDERTEAISTYGNGLYLYDKPTGELTPIGEDVIDTPYLTGLFVDDTGCIWLTEDYLGVKCLRMKHLQYQLQPLVSPSAIQDANYIRCIAQMTDSTLLCSNQMGDLFRYDLPTGQSTFLRHNDSRVYAALADRFGTEWIGTRGKGLFRNGKPIAGLPSPDVFSIKDNSPSGLWVAMLGGGVARLRYDGTVTDTLLAGRNCHDLQADHLGRWWVAAEDSLYIINVESGRYEARGMRSGYFVCLYFSTADSNLWAGSIGGGLLNCTTRQQYTSNNGLASNNIYSITADTHSRLWIGSEEGLSSLHPPTGDIRNYSFTQQPLSNVFSEQTALPLPDGRLLFGTHDGLLFITPDAATTTCKPAPTRLTGLLVNGAARTDSKSLSYTENNLTFLFSNFQYAQLTNIVYQYRLDGFNRDWCVPTKEHSASYRHLPPGSYTFRVRSSNGMGIWSEETAASIRIGQPWWNSGWAWTLYLALMALLSLMAARLLRLRRRLDIERQVAIFKTDFYNRLERELRTPVNILQGAAENVQLSGNTKTTIQSLRRGSSRVLKLMDMLRQFNKDHTPDDEQFEQRFHDIVDAIHADEQEFRELAPPPINRQTILIMATDEDSLTHLTDTLNPYFHIVGCHTADECDNLTRQHQPDLLLIDITTDEKTCRQLTRQLADKQPGLPIVHLSSFSDQEHELRSLRSGAADYIVKPFGGKVLVERAKRLIEARGHADRPATTYDTPYPSATTAQPDATPLITDVKDKKFIDRFHAILAAHITDDNFSVEQFADLMGLGRTQFYKRVKALTGETPVQHLHRARLKNAGRLLRDTSMNIDDIMLRAGFRSPTHFYNSFKKQFGMSPKEYRNSE